MILKLLAPLAAVSVAYAIPASLRGAITGRALTEETPKDDEAPEAAAGPEGTAIAGMDAATQQDLVDGILRDPSTARGVIASALGLKPSAANRLLRPEVASPCADLLAFCAKYKLAGPVCDFASSDCGGIKDMSKFFEEPEDDAEAIPGVPVDPDLGININLPGGISFEAGVNLELGEGSGPGLSIAGKAEGGVKAEVDSEQNPLGFGVGVEFGAGVDGETGVDGGLDMGGVDLEFNTQGSSEVGILSFAELGDSSTYGQSAAKMDGETGFQVEADRTGANVAAGASGSAVAGTAGETDVMGTDVATGSSSVGVDGAVKSNSSFNIRPTLSSGGSVLATGGVTVGAGVSVLDQDQTLDASVGGAVQKNIKNAVSPAGAGAAGNLDVVGVLKLNATGDLLSGSTNLTVPLIDVGFKIGDVPRQLSGQPSLKPSISASPSSMPSELPSSSTEPSSQPSNKPSVSAVNVL